MRQQLGLNLGLGVPALGLPREGALKAGADAHGLGLGVEELHPDLPAGASPEAGGARHLEVAVVQGHEGAGAGVLPLHFARLARSADPAQGRGLGSERGRRRRGRGRPRGLRARQGLRQAQLQGGHHWGRLSGRPWHGQEHGPVARAQGGAEPVAGPQLQGTEVEPQLRVALSLAEGGRRIGEAPRRAIGAHHAEPPKEAGLALDGPLEDDDELRAAHELPRLQHLGFKAERTRCVIIRALIGGQIVAHSPREPFAALEATEAIRQRRRQRGLAGPGSVPPVRPDRGRRVEPLGPELTPRSPEPRAADLSWQGRPQRKLMGHKDLQLAVGEGLKGPALRTPGPAGGRHDKVLQEVLRLGNPVQRGAYGAQVRVLVDPWADERAHGHVLACL
mmetsp:Transcript_34019/g.97252  ORF Transcript_34019/g.97252 Transcript_34019/m.97252 type:complete len:391 (-) Transcript_34019:1754-2926(-)